MWFYTFNGKKLCLFLKLFKKKQISDIYIKRACFNTDLCSGTILYGTQFEYENKKFFNVEDIFYFKNKNVSSYNQKEKLKIISNLFKKNIRQKIIFENDIIFGLPLYIEKKRF